MYKEHLFEATNVLNAPMNKLMGKDIHQLYEELRSEYVEQAITDEQSYITYVRKAISLFQVGEKI